MVFAYRAVAAGCCSFQYAVAIQQTDGNAVVFGLAGVFNRLLGAQALPHTLIKGDKLFCVQGIVQRQHGAQVRYLRKGAEGFSAHALGWGIRGYPLWMATLQFLQLAHQAVVLSVRNLRIVEHVIAVIVSLQFRLQLLEAEVFRRSVGHGAQDLARRRLRSYSITR
jgi:hypothetical protein